VAAATLTKATISTLLTWHVFLSEPWPVVTTDLPPNLTHRIPAKDPSQNVLAGCWPRLAKFSI
jgi:hypothetical protein